MGFPREAIASVKERADIVEVIGERVHLAPSGADFLGLCPFHGEKSPSFRVSPAWKTYHCFGCGVGGSVIDFLMASDHLSFPEAVTTLAERFGVPLPDSGGGERASRSMEALAAAREYYSGLLLERPEGEAARNYLLQRGFDQSDWNTFGLGFALDDWQAFRNFGQSHGYSLEDLVESGLVRTGQSGRPFDMLRKRVVFPIMDERGRPIAYGGRVIDPADSPKYINTPETRHYRKGKVLFGLAQGLPALRESRRALLVEGYLDVMRLHQHGFQEALATCGTALTEAHLSLLQRHADHAILLFDGDEAGIKATLRCAPLFLNQGIEARVALLPDGMDPDDFLVTQGREAFAEQLGRAEPLLQFLVFQLLERNGRSVQGREKALEELAPILAQVRKATARDLTVRYLSDLIGVRAEAIFALLENTRAQTPQGPGTRSTEGGGQSGAAMPSLALREGRHQRRVLRLLLLERGLLARAREMLRPVEFSEPALRQLLEKLLGFTDEEFSQIGPDELMEWYPELAPTLRALLVDEPLHTHAISEPRDYPRQLENELFCIKEDLKEQLFRKLRALEGSPEEEGELARYRQLRDELATMKAGFRNTRKPRPELILRQDPAPAALPFAQPDTPENTPPPANPPE